MAKRVKRSRRRKPIDFDSPWKEALEKYLRAFLALCFPAIHADIDWARGWESLDKEFQQIVRQAKNGRRYVDKLFRVWRRDGREAWVLIHIEVQAKREAKFPARMHDYNARASQRYNRPVVSLAVLADDSPTWRPTQHHEELWGCERTFVFPAVKLWDYLAREAALEASDNPFAPVILAHLKALQTRQDANGRRLWKTRLVRGLYERGFSTDDVRELFRLIDWMLELPPALETLFEQDLAQLEEEKHMPYVTSIERRGIEKGRKEGRKEGREEGLRLAVQELLRVKFGAAGVALMPRLPADASKAKLQKLIRALVPVTSLDDARNLIR